MNKDQDKKTDNAEEEEQEGVEDLASDITDKFIQKDDLPANLDIQIEGSIDISQMLYRLSGFLLDMNLNKEALYAKSLISYASDLYDDLDMVYEDGNSNRRRDIIKILKDRYYKNLFDTDFGLEDISAIGLSPLEADFLKLFKDGLSALFDLNIDGAIEALWAAYGLTPENMSDFDKELATVEGLLFKDITQERDEDVQIIYNVRDDLKAKLLDWIKYREPNFEYLNELGVKSLEDIALEEFPDLDENIDNTYGEEPMRTMSPKTEALIDHFNPPLSMVDINEDDSRSGVL